MTILFKDCEKNFHDLLLQKYLKSIAITFQFALICYKSLRNKSSHDNLIRIIQCHSYLSRILPKRIKKNSSSSWNYFNRIAIMS